ncbi:MAG: hypothetical protein U9R74_19500 [Pseudomonadota bacterium]|nr:hypothetical protein [Pseudomonadota bacterium]
MKTLQRKISYSMSALAMLIYFLYPDPVVALVVALCLQTLAFIVVGGSSPLDGFLLTGISVLMIALLPTDHPLVHSSTYFEHLRAGMLMVGASLVLVSISVMVLRGRH